MPEQSDHKILIFDVDLESEIEPTNGGPQPASGAFRKAFSKLIVKSTEVAVDTVKYNMTLFLADVQKILDESNSKLPKGFNMEEIEVNASISAEGKIGFFGSGAGLSGNSGIKFVFKRQ